MKLSCETKEIAAAVGAASKVVNAHTTVPILSNVLIAAENGSVSVRATDLELTLEQRLKAEIEEPGSITVPAKLFAGYLANLPSTSTIDLSGTPNRVSVKCERTNYDFNALPGEEYPPLPAAVKGAQFALSGKRLREGIEAVIFAAATEEARGAVMMGTLLEIEGDKLTMVATDGYRLARSKPRSTNRRAGTSALSFLRELSRRRRVTSPVRSASTSMCWAHRTINYSSRPNMPP